VVRLLVNIDVNNLEKGIEFYRAALGFTLKRRRLTGRGRLFINSRSGSDP
jgi:catechol 2,3-dioxygenase-like lactoylglutathione lyase family enzyme